MTYSEKGGRPRKGEELFTPERRKMIVELVRAGNYFETAASCAGINPRTLRDWMRRGERQKEGDLREFFEAVMQARAEAEAYDVSLISSAARPKYAPVFDKDNVPVMDPKTGQQMMKLVDRGDWKAAAWKQERLNPKHWGVKFNLELHDALGGFLEAVEAEFKDDPKTLERIYRCAAQLASYQPKRLIEG